MNGIELAPPLPMHARYDLGEHLDKRIPFPGCGLIVGSHYARIHRFTLPFRRHRRYEGVGNRHRFPDAAFGTTVQEFLVSTIAAPVPLAMGLATATASTASAAGPGTCTFPGEPDGFRFVAFSSPVTDGGGSPQARGGPRLKGVGAPTPAQAEERFS